MESEFARDAKITKSTCEFSKTDKTHISLPTVNFYERVAIITFPQFETMIFTIVIAKSFSPI